MHSFYIISYQLHIPRPAPHTPSPHRTPSYNPNITPLHLKPAIRSLYKYLSYVAQCPDENRFIFIRLINHANTTRRIIEPL